MFNLPKLDSNILRDKQLVKQNIIRLSDLLSMNSVRSMLSQARGYPDLYLSLEPASDLSLKHS